MPDPTKILPRIKARLDEIWADMEAAEDAGDEVIAEIHRQKFADLEEFETRLRAEIKASKAATKC